MKKPTRRFGVTAGCIALVAAVLSASGAQAIVPGSTPTHLDANRVAGVAAHATSAHPTLSAPAIPAGASPAADAATPVTPVTPVTVVLPPAPGQAPAKDDATTQAPVAAGNPGSSGNGSTKKTTTSGGGGGGGAAAPAAGDGYAEHADIANAVYTLLNQERAQNGLAALGRSGQLNSSAHAHNVAMANTGQFAHQVSGEADLGTRINATGYHWSSAGENIAWGSSASISFAQQLETEMYNEPPNQPNHRANILSTSFHNVGVDVITDGNGKMWITCDFGS